MVTACLEELVLAGEIGGAWREKGRQRCRVRDVSRGADQLPEERWVPLCPLLPPVTGTQTQLRLRGLRVAVPSRVEGRQECGSKQRSIQVSFSKLGAERTSPGS